MRVLVVDDEPTSRVIAEAALRNFGHECHTFADGAQAWEATQSLRPDVVISDWTMPGLTGLELCANVRAQGPDAYTYFILVTAHGEPHQIIRGMQAGADDYLVKPLDVDDLQVRLIAASRITSLHRRLASQKGELESLNRELTTIALRDPLTGLGNRRALEEDLELLQARAIRYGHRYCLALIDIDYFKAYNDAFGHQAGDHALQVVASHLTAQARGGDALYRYGGEEFLCVFPEQTLGTAAIAVERMRTGMEDLGIPSAAGNSSCLTVSAGLAMLDPDHTRSTHAVLKEADEALYRAKQLGRNRVESAGIVVV